MSTEERPHTAEGASRARLLAEVALLGVAVIGTVIAHRPTAEFSAHMAVDVSTRMWAGPFARVHLPEGLGTETFRPFSVVIVRIFAALGGPLSPAVGALKAFLSAGSFAVAAILWGRSRGASWVAPAAALLTLLTPAGWFNTIHLSELDLMGAALLLLGDRALRSERRGALALWPFAAAILLKDSVALAAVALVAGHVVSGATERRKRAWSLLWTLSGALFVFFISGATPSRAGHGGVGAAVARAALVVGAQWAALLSVPVLLSLLGPIARDRGARNAVIVVLGVASAAAWFQPDPALRSLFLCYLPERGDALPLLVGAAWCGLIALVVSTRGTERAAGTTAALGLAVVFVVLPGLLRMRDDTSTRVFLPLLPFVLEAVLFRLRALWQVDSKPVRAALIVGLGPALLWQSAVPGLSFLGGFLATEAVEWSGKSDLVSTLDKPTIVVGLDRTWEITATELIHLRPDAAVPLTRRATLPPMGTVDVGFLEGPQLGPADAARAGWGYHLWSIGWSSADAADLCERRLRLAEAVRPSPLLPRLGVGPAEERRRACVVADPVGLVLGPDSPLTRSGGKRAAYLEWEGSWSAAVRATLRGLGPWERRVATASWWSIRR